MSKINTEDRLTAANKELGMRVAQLEKTLLEQERIAKALQDSEKRYRQIFESAGDGILILDADTGKVVDVNQSLTKLLGYSYDELCGRHIWELGAFKEIAASKDSLKLLREESYIRYEDLTLQTRDGTQVSVEFVTNVYMLNHTKVIQCNVHDITERKKAEELLAQRVESTGNIFEQAVIGISLTSSDGNPTVNKAFCDMLGYSREEISKLRWQQFTHPDDVERDQKIIDSIVAGKRNSMRWQKRYIRKGGQIVWAEVSTALQRDAAGKQLYFVTTAADITERKRLEERQAGLNRVLEESLNEIYIFSVEDFRFIEVNKGARTNTGYSIEELRKMTPLDLKPEFTRQSFSELVSSLLTGERELTVFETIHRRKNASSYPVEVHLQCSTYDGRSVFLAIILDITKRRRVEEQLSESEERFRSLYENSTIGLYRTTPEGRIILANPTLVKMLGYSTFEELASRNLEQDGFEPSYERKQFIEQIEHGGEVHGLEAAWTRHDGSILYVRENARAIRDSNGKTLYYDGSVEDITERKQTELALRESEERFHSLFTFSPDALYVHVDGRITLVNPALCKLLGADDPSQLIGKSVFEIVHPDYHEKVRERWNLMIGGQPAPLLEEKFIRLDGTLVDVDVNAIAIDRKGSKETQVIIRDITERKRAEVALQKMQSLLNETQEITRVGGWEYDVASARVTWTDEVYRIHGLSKDYDPGNPEKDIALYTPEDQKQLDLAFKKAVEEGEPYDLELQLINAAGTNLWVRTIGTAEKRDGRVVRVFGNIIDITEHHQAREAILNERLLLRTLIDNIPDSIYSKDLSCRKTLANAADVHNLRAKSEAEVLGKNDFEFYSKEVAQRFFDDDQSIIRTGQAVLNREEFVFDKKGKKRWLLTSKLPLRNKEGHIIGLIGIGRDITDRKRAEEALQKSLDNLQLIMNSIHDVVYSVDGKTQEFTYLSPAFERLLGYKMEDIWEMGGRKPFLSRVIQDGKFTEQDHVFQQLISGKADGPTWVSWWRRKDGALVCLEDRSVPVFEGKQMVGTQGILFDITERMRAEEKLRESEEKYRSLFNNSEVGMFRTRLDGSDILEFNEKYLKILNYTREEVVGKPSVNMWADKVEREKMVQMLRAEGRVDDFEFDLLNKQGEVRKCVTSLRLYRDTGILEGSIQDITERRQAELHTLKHLEELRKWQDVTLGREDRIRQLKREVNQLLIRSGETIRYSSEEKDAVIGSANEIL